MLRVLVAEDNENQRKILCKFLQKHQFEVLPACDGEEALDILAESRIDIAICDVMMPKMDGFELTRSLRDQTLPAGRTIAPGRERALSGDGAKENSDIIGIAGNLDCGG